MEYSDISEKEDFKRQRLDTSNFVDAYHYKKISQAEYWKRRWELYPEEKMEYSDISEEDFRRQQTQALVPQATSIQSLEQQNEPVNLHGANLTFCNEYSTILPTSANLVNYPVHRQMTPNPWTVPIENAINALHVDGGFDDYESMKAIIVINLVELTLMVMAQNPRELARFFPVSLLNFVISQLAAAARQRILLAGEYYLLNLLRQHPGLQEKITPDLLFNCDMRKTLVGLNLTDTQDTQLCFELNDCLGWNHLHYPFLYYATVYDLQAPTQNNLLAKAYSLAAKLGINTNDPFKHIINFNDLGYNNKFAVSTTDSLRPQNLPFIDIYGENGAVRQVLFPFTGPYGGISYFPVTAISCPNEMPKMMFLPQSNMPVIGLYDLLYRNKKNIVLTPRISTALNNIELIDVTVLSWWGGIDTIDLVDLAPLTGKTIHYLLCSRDFAGNEDKMLNCWQRMTERLTAINCTVNFIYMTGEPITANGLQQSNQPAVTLNCMYRRTDMEFEIYKANQVAEFYKRLGRTPPAGVVDFSLMAIDLEGTSKEEIRPLFTGLLSRGDIAMIYGQAGLGKTQLAHSIAHALAAGKDLNSRHQFAAIKPPSVLMLTGEMRTDQLHIRDGWFKAMYPKNRNDAFFQMCRFEQNLAEPEGKRTLNELITHFNQDNRGKNNIGVIILDSLKTLTCDGDSAKKWNALFTYLAKARDERGLTFIIVHHPNKAGEQFFGSVDIDVKLDLMIHLSKQVPNLKEQFSGLGLSDSRLRQYTNFLAAKHRAKFSGDHVNDIRFFFTITKGRSLKNSDKNTLLMSFLPEKASLGWDVVDIFAPESSWSYEAWEKQQGATSMGISSSSKVNQTQDTDAATVPEFDEIPSVDQLKKMTPEELLANLERAVQAGCSSRSKVGQYFGITTNRKAKDTIDYLMKKHNLKNEDIGIGKP